MTKDRLRNFTVRFLESALSRVETAAKPFYGGRLSTGEALRRLAEERLEQIESDSPQEQTRDALLRILRTWRAGQNLALADLQFLANCANTAYQRCRKDFVSRELLVANVSAFRDAVQVATRGKSKGIEPEERYFLGNLATSKRIEAKTLQDYADKWIAVLADSPGPPQAELASRNLLTYLRDEKFSDESQLVKTLGPHLSALFQVAIRGYWYSEGSGLTAPTKGPAAWPKHMTPVQQGRISLSALVREEGASLAVDSSAHHSIITANTFVEVEDLAEVTGLAAAGQEVRGEAFQW
ncbi:MAG: hypothetical protein ACREQ5_23860, partial [Candidatus Dormibacteria bacterium]